VALPFQPPRKPAEYKQVTVLFADVLHSMDIAAAAGAERLREIMAELVNLSSRRCHDSDWFDFSRRCKARADWPR
jgi:class 3 adenylate cyclase